MSNGTVRAGKSKKRTCCLDMSDRAEPPRAGNGPVRLVQKPERDSALWIDTTLNLILERR
jgi:hypothetical protein